MERNKKAKFYVYGSTNNDEVKKVGPTLESEAFLYKKKTQIKTEVGDDMKKTFWHNNW